jgi:hypothetical protein
METKKFDQEGREAQNSFESTTYAHVKKTCIGTPNNVLCRFVAEKNLKQCGY